MTASETPKIGVVIADDHRMFADGLARLLEEQPDIEVLDIAVNGEQLLEMVARLKPRVALVDYQMPERDGVAIAADIKARHPDIMLVMLTGSTEDRVFVAAIEAGCSGFITKDRAAAEVVEAVRSAAVGEAVISAALLARLLPRLSRTEHVAHSELTERELQILVMLAKGISNKTIASELFLSVNTVRNYVQSLLTKLNAHSKLEAVAAAVRAGLIDYPSH
jgi:two-component system response regulator DevR